MRKLVPCQTHLEELLRIGSLVHQTPSRMILPEPAPSVHAIVHYASIWHTVTLLRWTLAYKPCYYLTSLVLEVVLLCSAWMHALCRMQAQLYATWTGPVLRLASSIIRGPILVVTACVQQLDCSDSLSSASCRDAPSLNGTSPQLLGLAWGSSALVDDKSRRTRSIQLDRVGRHTSAEPSTSGSHVWLVVALR